MYYLSQHLSDMHNRIMFQIFITPVFFRYLNRILTKQESQERIRESCPEYLESCKEICNGDRQPLTSEDNKENVDPRKQQGRKEEEGVVHNLGDITGAPVYAVWRSIEQTPPPEECLICMEAVEIGCHQYQERCLECRKVCHKTWLVTWFEYCQNTKCPHCRAPFLPGYTPPKFAINHC